MRRLAVLPGTRRPVRSAHAALLVLLLLPLAAGRVAAQAPSAVPPFDTSRVYASEAAFQQAIQPYQAAITANPANARAHYWLGVAYFHAYRLWRAGLAPYAAGYLPRAIASLREAVQRDPAWLSAYLVLHDALFMAERHDEAARVLQTYLDRTRPAARP
ncbi:MAG: tetratricopeptide repeat protein [Armatimonadota bacterium]|nr:tetratricopeptide repeat protein [Armatimonadota bacterium]MDR7447671.1 tetratricopeptide repeat protein [Armatimonadota bacterium]MDR7459006.1 tetratricopeptide repeat protein [Armatimonadota bacterium]MDR7480107.1 tetratricopeptide repeat protein [Armatimonadota bacterium]MDR7489560.1 tetratricopeptide repeat protein [Armatimonadota bacterium]